MQKDKTGGYQSQNITNQYPNLFQYIGVMSMGLFSSYKNSNVVYNKEEHLTQLRDLLKAKPKFYWMGIGKKDFLFDTVTELRGIYDNLGFPYDYRESEGAHNWNEWRMYLTKIVPRFFK